MDLSFSKCTPAPSKTIEYTSFRSKFFSSNQCHQYHYYYSQYYSQPRPSHANFLERLMKKNSQFKSQEVAATTKKNNTQTPTIINKDLELSIESMSKILTDNQIEYELDSSDDDEILNNNNKVSLFTSNDSLFSNSSRSSLYFKSNTSSLTNTNDKEVSSTTSPSSKSSSLSTISSRIEDLEWEPILSNENIYDRLCDYTNVVMDTLRLTHIQSMSENDLLFCSNLNNNKSIGYGTATSQSTDSICDSCSSSSSNISSNYDFDEYNEEKSIYNENLISSFTFPSKELTTSISTTTDTTFSTIKEDNSEISTTQSLKYVLVLFDSNKNKQTNINNNKKTCVYTNNNTRLINSSSSSSSSCLSLCGDNDVQVNKSKSRKINNGNVSISMKIKGY